MWILVPVILMIPVCFNFIDKRIFIPIIRFEEWIIWKIFPGYKKTLHA
jgi:hypothetical protein